MRQYETAFLIAPNLPEEDNEKLVSQMAEVISKKKGNMINVDEWGKRKLAYPIQKFEEAYYVFFLYEGDPSIPVELERRFKQTETIIRYMTVKNEITESARKRGRASTKKKRETAGMKEEKTPKKEEEPKTVPIEDLEKEPKEKPAEKPIEEPKKVQKAEPKEAQSVAMETEPKEKPKEKSKEDPKAELKAESKDKAEEKSQEKLPPEDKEKKEK